MKKWIWRNLQGNHKQLQHASLTLSPLPSGFCHSHFFISEVLRYGTAVLRCSEAFIRNTCWAQCFPLVLANNEASTSADIQDLLTVFVWSVQHIFSPHKHLIVIRDCRFLCFSPFRFALNYARNDCSNQSFWNSCDAWCFFLYIIIIYLYRCMTERLINLSK